MRSATRSRYYLQVPLTDKVEKLERWWFLDQSWKRRLPDDVAWKVDHRSDDWKGALRPLRSFVWRTDANMATFSWSAMLLTSYRQRVRKGLNLAASDVATLNKIFNAAFIKTVIKRVINQYSEICLRRVWHGERFSWWMTSMLHDFGDDGANSTDAETYGRFMSSELNFLYRQWSGPPCDCNAIRWIALRRPCLKRSRKSDSD